MLCLWLLPGTVLAVETADLPTDAPDTFSEQANTNAANVPEPAELKSDLPKSTVNGNLLPQTRTVSTENNAALRAASGSRGNNQSAVGKPLLADEHGLLADKPSMLGSG